MALVTRISEGRNKKSRIGEYPETRSSSLTPEKKEVITAHEKELDALLTTKLTE